MWKRAASVCTTVGALVAAGLTLAAPASASSVRTLTWNGAVRATGGFNSVSEYFFACDKSADGHGVNVYWYVVSNPSHSGVVRDGDGADGDCHRDYVNIGEGNAVKYQVCLTDSGVEQFACTSWTDDVA
jgi:hypothetical protein